MISTEVTSVPVLVPVPNRRPSPNPSFGPGPSQNFLVFEFWQGLGQGLRPGLGFGTGTRAGIVRRAMFWRLVRRLLRHTAFHAVLALAMTTADGSAQSSSHIFDELKAEYLSIRNTDANVSRPGEWIFLAQRFESFTDNNHKNIHADEALYHAAILYERMHLKLGGDDRLEKAGALLKRIVRDYPESDLADDALLKQGDYFLERLSEPDQARRSYQAVVTNYPESDMFEVARAKLESLKRGSNQQRINVKSNTSGNRKSGPLILIDPGHGGEDYGAVGLSGLLEKDVVLDIALRLEKLLRERDGVVVRLTRNKDIFVPLSERTALANDFEADLFLSLHTNASPNGKLEGLETYYLDNAEDAASKKLAERENASMHFEGAEGDLAFMLSDLIQNAKMEDSIALANILHTNLLGHVKRQGQKVASFGVKRGPFYVLVGAHMPCVLIELLFIDHPSDAKRLAEPQFRQVLAAGLFRGIENFLVRKHSLALAK